MQTSEREKGEKMLDSTVRLSSKSVCILASNNKTPLFLGRVGGSES